MKKYKELKNLGGGFLWEFQNCVNGLYSAAKYKDDIAVELYYKKLDEWELEHYKQNQIMFAASKDKSVGIPTFLINSILIA